MLEEYLQVQGREWERFAWLKSRVVAPRRSVEDGRALALRGLVTAFVYRRYLDYGVFEGLRQLHAKVRDEAQRRAAGRPERANDVKLSRGGIREMDLDRVAVDLAQDVEEVAGVESDFEPIGAVVGGEFLGRETVLGRGDREGHAVTVEADLDRAGLLAGDGRDAVDACLEAGGVELQQLVVGGRNDTAVVREGPVDQFRGQHGIAQSEADLRVRQ